MSFNFNIHERIKQLIQLIDNISDLKIQNFDKFFSFLEKIKVFEKKDSTEIFFENISKLPTIRSGKYLILFEFIGKFLSKYPEQKQTLFTYFYKNIPQFFALLYLKEYFDLSFAQLIMKNIEITTESYKFCSFLIDEEGLSNKKSKRRYKYREKIENLIDYKDYLENGFPINSL